MIETKDEKFSIYQHQQKIEIFEFRTDTITYHSQKIVPFSLYHRFITIQKQTIGESFKLLHYTLAHKLGCLGVYSQP